MQLIIATTEYYANTEFSVPTEQGPLSSLATLPLDFCMQLNSLVGADDNDRHPLRSLSNSGSPKYIKTCMSHAYHQDIYIRTVTQVTNDLLIN